MSSLGPLQLSPDAAREFAASGAAAATWLTDAPALAEQCAVQWGLDLGYVTEEPQLGLSVRASRAHGSCTLKLFPPGDRFAIERAVLAAADGHGYQRLLEVDVERGALLLESVGESLRDRPLTAEPADGVLAAVVAKAWELPLVTVRLTDTSVAEHLAAEIERLASHHDPGGVIVARALTYAAHRCAEPPERQVVLHGEPSSTSVRAVHACREGAETGYVLVDPRGLRGAPEYDLGYWLSSDNRFVLSSSDPLVALRARSARLAGVTGTDAEAVWQWTMLHRVHRGMAALADGDPQEGRLFLAAAKALTAGQLR